MPSATIFSTQGSPELPRTVRHTELWFEDGTIVIQAQHTLYKSSEQTAEDTYDGSPLLKLQEPAADITLLLWSLFDANFLEEKCTLQDHIPLLFLGVKFQTRRLLRRVMVALEHNFPSTLGSRDHWAHEQNLLDDGYSPTDVPSCCLGRSRHLCQVHRYSYNLVDLVNAARTTEMLALLPAALHIACMVPLTTIVKSGRFDGMLQVNRDAVIYGQRRLDNLARETSYRVLFSDARSISPFCQNRLECHLQRHALIKQLERDPCGFVRPFKAPSTFLNYGPVKKLCNSCQAELTSSHLQGRKEAWERLPLIFDLPSWADMLQTQREIMGDS